MKKSRETVLGHRAEAPRLTVYGRALVAGIVLGPLLIVTLGLAVVFVL